MKKHKILAGLLAMSLAAGLVACGGSESSSTAPTEGSATEGTQAAGEVTSAKDTIIFAQPSEPSSLDPYIDTDTGANTIMNLIYNTLWQMEDDGSFTPELATEWEWVDDTHLAVTLREGVTFSNGNAFTAEDVVYTLGYAATSTLAANYAKVDLENTTIEDDTHLTIAFTEVDPTFMSYTGKAGSGSILDKESCEADESTINLNPVGTGQYVMTNWASGDSITFARNESYWGEDKAIIPNVIFRYIQEPTQRTIELQSGGVDYVLTCDVLDIPTLEEDPNFKVISEPSTMVHKLFFNETEGHPMADENLRKAVAYCISNEDIVAGVFSGVAAPANSTVSPRSIGFAESLGGELMYEQDYEKAKEYLEASNYSEGLTLNAIVNEGDFVDEFEIIKNELSQIGITLNIATYDFTTALTYALDKTGDWDLYMLANGCDTAVMQLAWYDENQGAPFARVQDEELFKILGEMYSTNDPDRQAELADEAQIYQMEHVTVYPLVVTNLTVAYDASLQNVDIDIDQMPDMSKVYFAE